MTLYRIDYLIDLYSFLSALHLSFKFSGIKTDVNIYAFLYCLEKCKFMYEL